MPKRKRPMTLQVDLLFNAMEKALREIDPNFPAGTATQVILRLLSEAGEEKEETKAAGQYTIADAVVDFNLEYKPELFKTESVWYIEDLPETKGFVPTPGFESLFRNYALNFNRSSKAGCRTGIDFILNECLTVMKGSLSGSETQPTKGSLPKSWLDIKIYGEVSFSHKIISSSPAVTVNGRVDYGIGVVLPRAKTPKRRFDTLLLAIEAKFVENVNSAVPQLVVYLACLRESRLQRKRKDASVHGVASDGYEFIFVTITHAGVLKRSKTFNLHGARELWAVMGCLKYILEMAATRSPNLTLERSGSWQVSVESDPGDPIQVDDSEYLHQPTNEDEDKEGEDLYSR